MLVDMNVKHINITLLNAHIVYHKGLITWTGTAAKYTLLAKDIDPTNKFCITNTC